MNLSRDMQERSVERNPDSRVEVATVQQPVYDEIDHASQILGSGWTDGRGWAVFSRFFV